jgi:signal transduction histidine kinase/serine phosphatase RsbU (regulator of sigma subunit)
VSKNPTAMSLPASESAGFLAGGGEAGALMRELDWARTPIGPPESWPDSLRTAVSICLSSRFPILLWWGEDLVMLYNDPYRPVLGASKHPLAMGGRGAAVWPEVWDVIGPMLHGVMATGEATWSEDQVLMLDRNGYVEECYFTFSYSPIRDSGGEVGGVFTAVTETTERVLADRRLRTVAELASRTAEAQSVGEVCTTAVAALATNPLDIPCARLRLGDAVASTGEQPEGTAPLVLEVRDAGELVAGTSPHRALDDDYREFFRLLADQIATAAATAAGREHERRRADALAELDRAKTEFFANVSHEFRTPLTLMLGPLADALGDADAALPAPQRDRVEIAQRSALRLLRLVNGLLDFSRLEAGGMAPALEPIDLTALVAEAASGFRSLMESAGLRLEIVRPREPVIAHADPEMTEKVVLNLLSNAYKFTLHGGVRVTVGSRDDRAALIVADTGTGIPEADLPHVFERFHRVRGTEGRSHEGTGIGLALVHELVSLQGGTVSVESELGEGSAFTVELPLSDRAPGPRKPSGEAAGALAEAARWGAPARPRTDARVLVADDNADMRDYVLRLLEPHWAVEGAADGAAALERARAGGLDLVVTDVMMPRLDGFGLLRALRADPATERLPVILVSARAGDEATVEGLGAGADDYLIKPFSAAELVARVRSHLELARLREAVATAQRDRAVRAEVVAEALQRSLLPERLPELPELDLAGRYVPAVRELRVGGDWYDAIPLSDGRVVLAIGDVAGHGVRAAAAMGQVSHALRAYAREGHPPAALLVRLDALVLAGDLGMVTCQLVLLDPATGELRWASAGHLPPLVAGHGAAARQLDGPGGHPLGVWPAGRFREGTGTLADGESLVLYTDGLVERRGEPIDAGMARLAAVLDGDAAAPTCDAALAGLLDGAEPADDVALLVARRRRLTAPEAGLLIPAEAERLRDARRWLEAWLRGNDLSGPRATDLLLAVHEAAMNAVEHAYGPRPGEVELRASRVGTRVEVAVRDAGRWRERTPRQRDRGRGAGLMAALVDEASFERTDAGTTVRLRTEVNP